jgi:hypothetical protein
MKLVRIALCTALLAASAAMGQTSPGDVVVDVPFAFVVAKQALPAGHYIVKPVGDTNFRIFNSQTTGLFVPTHGALRTVSDGSKLVFHRYGDTYFLSQVWVAGNTIGRELPRSPAEREAMEHTGEMELAVIRPSKLHPAK